MAMPRLALKQRREELNLTQEQVALAAGVATSTYRGWELGAHTPLLGHRPKLTRVLKVSRQELDRMLFGQLVELNGQAVPAWLGHLVALEQGAAELLTYQPVVVHALLQTPEYATAVERAYPVGLPDDVVARRVDKRLARQRVLDRDHDALRLRAVLDESVLHRVAGNPSVMEDQLSHLVVMAARPNVDLRVLPLDAGVFAAAFGAFLLLRSPDSPAPYTVVTEDRGGAHYYDHAIEAHVQLFHHLLDAALSPDESIDLIEATNKEQHQP